MSHSFNTAFSVSIEIQLTEKNIIGHVPKISKSWYLSLWITLTQPTMSWQNIFHVTATGKFDNQNRIPALFQKPFEEKCRLQYQMIVIADIDAPLNVPVHLKAIQKLDHSDGKYHLKIFINNTNVNDYVIQNPVKYFNVPVVASGESSSETWNAVVKDIQFGNL